MYENELKALKKAGRFRERKIYDVRLDDLASNDYLGLSRNKKQFKKAVKLVNEYTTVSSKASMLVNGYHPIHRIFEKTMAEYNGFEEGLVVGSGFLANMALIEALVRKGDMLFMDEEYHASGVMASNFILPIVDEAHSAGVLGKELLGIFEYYGLAINERHIKMGTLGKAYGSYGAYILASKNVISFLENRAKPIIYSTAPSVFDTALALVNLEHIRKNAAKYTRKILERQKIVSKQLGIPCQSLIIPMEMPNNEQTLFVQKGLMEQGYLVGAIRQPTVEKPIMRVILNLGVSTQKIRHVLALISHNTIQ